MGNKHDAESRKVQSYVTLTQGAHDQANGTVSDAVNEQTILPLQKMVSNLKLLVAREKTGQALQLLQKIYASFPITDLFDSKSQTVRSLAWEIVDLKTQLAFGKKYATDL